MTTANRSRASCCWERRWVTGRIARHPIAWWFARIQAARGLSLTSRLHRTLPLTSALEPLVVCRLDGSRTPDALIAELRSMIAVDGGDPGAALTEAVGQILRRCAREGVLIEEPP